MANEMDDESLRQLLSDVAKASDTVPAAADVCAADHGAAAPSGAHREAAGRQVQQRTPTLSHRAPSTAASAHPPGYDDAGRSMSEMPGTGAAFSRTSFHPTPVHGPATSPAVRHTHAADGSQGQAPLESILVRNHHGVFFLTPTRDGGTPQQRGTSPLVKQPSPVAHGQPPPYGVSPLQQGSVSPPSSALASMPAMPPMPLPPPVTVHAGPQFLGGAMGAKSPLPPPPRYGQSPLAYPAVPNTSMIGSPLPSPAAPPAYKPPPPPRY